MADTNAVFTLSKKLAEAVLQDDWKASLILAADLKAAHEAPQTFAAWTPSSPRNAS